MLSTNSQSSKLVVLLGVVPIYTKQCLQITWFCLILYLSNPKYFHTCLVSTNALPDVFPIQHWFHMLPPRKKWPWARKKQLQQGTLEKLGSEFGTVMSSKVGLAIPSKPAPYPENSIRIRCSFV